MAKTERKCSCGSPLRADNATGRCRACYDAERRATRDRKRENEEGPALVSVEGQLVARKLVAERDEVKRRLSEALDELESFRYRQSTLEEMAKGLDRTIVIRPHEGSGTSEATPVILASDWHAEEVILPAQVNGLNAFNLDVAHARIERFFQASLNLIKNHLNPGVAIRDVLVFLGGDFITNDIHDELVENVALGPMKAIVWVYNRLVAGINFWLNHSAYNYTFVCKVGNHARTTKKVHFSKENEHSLEYLLYVMLAEEFKDEPRVKFEMQDGYHSYVTVYDKVIRFHHGHAINYGGGIGGLTIPVTKAIAGWDKGRRADLDCFGHFHQTVSNQKFKCNGSLIGYNAFAVRIKADYEIPQQTMFLVDKKRGVTCTWPILVEKK